MTIPFDPADPAPITAAQAASTANPYYVRDLQGWAIQQERQRHDQVLYSLGEYCAFVLLWHESDHRLGLVERCDTCSGANGTIRSRVQDVYKQPTQNKCPDCYGTTFEGGYRALIFRPALFGDADEAEQKTARGVVESSQLSVESTTDFLIRNGDYVFRANGDRYYLRAPMRTTLRTGFGKPNMTDMTINYNQARASLEDNRASVAYELPPDQASLRSILTQGRYYPHVFAAHEQIRGPLIPEGE